MADRHGDFLARGGRVYGLSADSAAQNSAVMEKLALPFPILSDPDRESAITPLGFADPGDPRSIALTAVAIIDPSGDVAFSRIGRDYADRPDEEELLEVLGRMGLPPTTQDPPEVGDAQPGESAVSVDDLAPYFRGAKFAVLALRRRFRDAGSDFAADTKQYVQMVERYAEALRSVEERRA